MLRKRLIFTLLYSEGSFFLSRNFRLQKVGDLNWLKKNFNFSKIAFCIDELIILNVGRDVDEDKSFIEMIKELTTECFIPVAVGGKIKRLDVAQKYFLAGADKLVINSALFQNEDLVRSLGAKYGSQSIIASVDIFGNDGGDHQILVDCGQTLLSVDVRQALKKIVSFPIGEVLLNSINRDGTGQGYDMNILDLLPRDGLKPVIMSGGVGNSGHLAQGLLDSRVDAVSTANLFNFVGDGFANARKYLIEANFNLPHWNYEIFKPSENK
jgi:cyclase